jgi:hypothetical protein
MDARKDVRNCQDALRDETLTLEEFLAGILLEERFMADRTVEIVNH